VHGVSVSNPVLDSNGAFLVAKAKLDPNREERIEMDIVVDAYDEEERAMGWYCYLQDTLIFPFTAICVAERSISSLQKGDEIEVLGMASADECHHEIFVEMRGEHKNKNVAFPLMQIKPISDTAEQTREAVADWHYWLKRGYEY
jgi:hypothetical protein